VFRSSSRTEARRICATGSPSAGRSPRGIASSPTAAATLWFELVNNRGRGAFDLQPESLRDRWLDNFGRGRSSTPPSEPLTCETPSAIETPTLALAAEHGMPYSRRIVELIGGCMPDCRLVDVPGVTHFMSYQAPTVFDRLVLDFLAEHR
jgi:pimeloyl-ACP methyl ester carboxylesterase